MNAWVLASDSRNVTQSLTDIDEALTGCIQAEICTMDCSDYTYVGGSFRGYRMSTVTEIGGKRKRSIGTFL